MQQATVANAGADIPTPAVRAVHLVLAASHGFYMERRESQYESEECLRSFYCCQECLTGNFKDRL